MNIFQKIKASLIYREAIRKADRAHNSDGGRYYVMPSAEGKLLIMDRKNFRIFKRKQYINSNATVKDMLNECFYCTPYRNGTEALPPLVVALKRKQYLSWCEAFHKINKSRRKTRLKTDN